jgi:threonine dehydratase
MSFDETRAAAAVARFCRRTPLVAVPALAAGVHLKLENLQRLGSFKLRGACAALAGMDAPAVVCASAGNHGQGVALAARALGRRATVVVPGITPPVKRDAIAALGAEVIVHGRIYDDAERHARALAAERGMPFVSPFDDDAVIFGNGVTTGREIAEQLGSVAQVVVPVGGGGLVAGIADVMAPRGACVVGVEPKANCAMATCLREDRFIADYEGGKTLCEGLEGGVAERAFATLRRHGARMATVSEAAVRGAIAYAYRVLGLVVEPSAAVGLAAVREQAFTLRAPCVVVITGANIEPDLLDTILRE